jgi:hypothetical protein
MNASPERVRADGLGDLGAAGDPADDPPGAVPVQPPAVSGQEDRSFAALADGQVDRPGGARRERDGDDLAALAGDDESPVPALHAESLYIWRVRPLYPARNPASASRSVLVNTGAVGTRAADGVVVVIGHLRGLG